MRSTILRILKVAGAGLAVALTACASSLVNVPALATSGASQPLAMTISPASPVSRLPAVAGTSAGGLGKIVMKIDWPTSIGFRAQTIPVAAQIINVFAVPAGQTSWSLGDASASVTYPATTATLQGLAGGNYTVTAQAFQPKGETVSYGSTQSQLLVAIATQSVHVAGNQTATATIWMTDVDPPDIESIRPTTTTSTLFWAPSGWPSNVNLLVSGPGLLGFGAATPSFSIGGSTCSVSGFTGGTGSGSDSFQTVPPSGFTGTGVASVSVDSLVSTYSIAFTLVNQVTVTPVSQHVSSGTGTVTFTASASEVNGAPLPPADMVFAGPALRGVMDGSTANSLGMWPGTMTATYDAVLDPTNLSTYVVTVSYTASTSLSIPDTGTTTDNLNDAYISIGLDIGNTTAAVATFSVM